MIYQIADLNVIVPEAGGMAPRCQAYLTDQDKTADICIDSTRYKLHMWQNLTYEQACYMESGYLFYAHLLQYDGIMLHASALAYNGKAFLFSGPSTVGKSTHTRQWQQTFGDAVEVFNDDKPALRCIDGEWYAYGTPWCGKDGINSNRKAPLGGICFLKQSAQNRIRRLSAAEALAMCMSQIQRFTKPGNVEKQLALLDKLVRSVPVWELENHPGEEAVRLSCATMYSEE